jgi:hypothetical protein
MAPLRRLPDGVALPSSPERDWLIGDIAMLVDGFARIAPCEAVSVRLEAIDHEPAGASIATCRGPGIRCLPPNPGKRRYRSR